MKAKALIGIAHRAIGRKIPAILPPPMKISQTRQVSRSRPLYRFICFFQNSCLTDTRIAKGLRWHRPLACDCMSTSQRLAIPPFVHKPEAYVTTIVSRGHCRQPSTLRLPRQPPSSCRQLSSSQELHEPHRTQRPAERHRFS